MENQDMGNQVLCPSLLCSYYMYVVCTNKNNINLYTPLVLDCIVGTPGPPPPVSTLAWILARILYFTQ
jgi:hypothetical protein